MKTISHKFQDIGIQNISDEVVGTSDLISRASELRESVLFCGVLYMAEDLAVMSNGNIDVFVPEILIRDDIVVEPRCPMERLSIDTILNARSRNADYVLTYINTSAIMKAHSDGVYNGTEAIRVIENLARRDRMLRVCLIGDNNVNYLIERCCRPRYPTVEIITAGETIDCPVHCRIERDELASQWKALCTQYGPENTGMALHSEVSKKLIDFGLDNGAYIGGTTGMTRLVSTSAKPAWVVATVEPFVQALRMTTGKEIASPGVHCPHMQFTQLEKVQRAQQIIMEEGPVADILLRREREPCYEIRIHKNMYTSRERNLLRIPAARVLIDRPIREQSRRSLAHLL